MAAAHQQRAAYKQYLPAETISRSTHVLTLLIVKSVRPQHQLAESNSCVCVVMAMIVLQGCSMEAVRAAE